MLSLLHWRLLVGGLTLMGSVPTWLLMTDAVSETSVAKRMQ